MSDTMLGGSQQALREANKRALLERLCRTPDGMTVRELAESVSLTTTAVTKLLGVRARQRGNWSPPPDSLYGVIEHGHVAVDRPRNSGPVPVVAKLDPKIGVALGLSISHEDVGVMLSDVFGRSLAPPRREPVPSDDFNLAMRRVVQLAGELVAEHGVAEQLMGIGVAVSAPVDVFYDPGTLSLRARFRFDLGPAIASPDINVSDPLEAIRGYIAALPEASQLASKPLHLDNDANLAARAELNVGAAEGARHIVSILWGAGIGGSVIVSGKLLHGAGGIAGEFGHTVLRDDPDLQCPRCGRSCLESEVAKILDAKDRAPDLGRVVEAALEGDEESKRRLKEASGRIARALATLITALNPDRVVLGGDFGPEAYEPLIKPMQTVIKDYAATNAARDAVLRIGHCGRDAPLVGAVWMVLARERLGYLLRGPITGPQVGRSTPSSPNGTTRTTAPAVALAS